MKKLFLMLAVFMAVLFISSCGQAPKNYKGEEMDIDNSLNPQNVVLVEGCEYFVVRGYSTSCKTYVHKGNCKNKIHYPNK